jgi:peptidoglycan/xylan/chitin deacetylase (PgdA/CDA1 family)
MGNGDTGGGPVNGTAGGSGGPRGARRARGGLGGSSMPAVLMYHSVTPYSEDPYLVTVSPARFGQQLAWLRDRGLRGVSVSTLLAARRAGEGRGLVALTFDDGYADFIGYAMPELARYGFGATVFPIAGLLGGENDWDERGPRKALMTAQQVKEAAAAGIEIGSHGLTHRALPGMTDGELAAEAGRSRALLQDASSQDVTGFCYPYGHLDTRVAGAVQAAGYDYACAIWRSPQTGPHAIPRTYIGDGDLGWRLRAKALRHWLTWDYRGPGAARVARLAAPAGTSPDAGEPIGVHHFA